MASPYARLQITIFGIKIDKQPPKHPHVHLRLGHRVYVTPKKLPDYRWDDTFEFEVSLHQHLFGTIQLDVYDSRFLLPHMHRGRAELRLSKLNRQSISFQPKWIELREKAHCYASLSSLGLRDKELNEHLTGSICMAIKYRFKKDDFLHPLNDSEGAGGGISPIIIRKGTRSNSLPTILPSMMHLEERIDIVKSIKEVYDSRYDLSGSMLQSPKGPVPSPRSAAGSTYSSLESQATLTVSRRGFSDEEEEEEEVEEVKAELSASREVNSLVRRISGWILTEDDHQAVQNLLNGIAAYGQGIEVGSIALTIAFLVLQRYYRRQSIEFTNNIQLTKNDIEIPRIIFRYAYAAHGWAAMYVFGKRSEIFSDVVSSDANYRAVMKFLQLDPKDMLICDLDKHQLFCPNFYVALDHRLGAVILSIRGTMSMRDTLTDLNFDYIPWNGGIAHSGMLESSKWFIENIASQLVLFAEAYKMNQIILTGHSLGGATAAFTSIMLTEQLERTGKWPIGANGQRIKIHCYTFGTPPIMSPELAKKYSNLIDTYIYGDDTVPRLSYGTMSDLQILMVYAAEICRSSDVFKAFEESGLQEKFDECRRAIQLASLPNTGQPPLNPKLHVPGRIHHIVKIKVPDGKSYTVIDTCDPERFCEIVLRKNMLTDHLPSRYEKAFESAYVTYLLQELEERQTTSVCESIISKLSSMVSTWRQDIFDKSRDDSESTSMNESKSTSMNESKSVNTSKDESESESESK